MGILELIEQGKVKRFFRSRNKINYSGAVCHITQRAPGKEPLFLEEGDYLYMLKLIKDSAKKFELDVYSFCLMPNHLHLLLKLNKANLPALAKNVFGSYALYFNKKYQRKGHVFAGAYREALCFDEAYLLAASLYIHLNPVRAALIQAPEEYRWSSCGLYLSTAEKSSFINYKFLLNILSNDLASAQKTYEELLRQSSGLKTREVWEDRLALDSFRMRLFKITSELISPKAAENRDNLDMIGDQEIERKIEELKSRKRLTSPQAKTARKYLIEQLKVRGYNLTEIAIELGISRKTIYQTLK